MVFITTPPRRQRQRVPNALRGWVEKRIKILRAGIWWEFAHYRKAPKTAQNGCRRAGVVPNPEFTPRNTTTGVFEFWRLAGPKETRSGNFYSLFHSPVGISRGGKTPFSVTPPFSSYPWNVDLRAAITQQPERQFTIGLVYVKAWGTRFFMH